MNETAQPAGRLRQKRSYAGLLDPANLVLTVCVIAALAFLVSATRKNSALIGQLQRIAKRVEEQSSLQKGDVVPPFTTVDADGKQAAFAFTPKQKQLLVIFSSHCSVCATQSPVWARLARQIKSDDVSIHGISLDSGEDTRAYLSSKALDFPVLLSPKTGFSRAYRVERIPQVLLLSEQGVVEWVHIGALTEEKLADLTARVKADETVAVSKTTLAGERN